MTTYPFSHNTNAHANLADHDAFVDGVPYATFQRLRQQDPIHWTPDSESERGFWSITRYHDVGRLNNNFRLMSSAKGIRIEDQSPEEFEARKTFQETDPPDHRIVRHSLNPHFSLETVSRYEQDIRHLAADILEQAIGLREFDAVEHIARRLPMLMLARILGIPDHDANFLVEMGDQLIANSDPEFTDFVIDQADTDEYRLLPFRSPAAIKLFDYAKQTRQAIQNGTHTTPGIMAEILAPVPPSEGGKPSYVMSEDEFRNFFCLLVAAGNDTTRYSIAGMMQILANNPTLFARLKAALDDSTARIWEVAADEFIRCASPTMHFRRTATRDITYQDKLIREGDKVILWFVSGNHDENVFPNPTTVDLDNPRKRHIAFGQGGPHVCLGMYLARLEVKVLLQVLLGRVESLQQTGRQSYLRSNFIGGIKQLPIAVTPH
ncbi:MAG: cytochrome P450 [Alphaproteobacteria bacterium]|nr:cytochrome P450 [Alphaproteobacteria bacterium]